MLPIGSDLALSANENLAPLAYSSSLLASLRSGLPANNHCKCGVG